MVMTYEEALDLIGYCFCRICRGFVYPLPSL